MVIFILTLFLIIFLYTQNNCITISKYNVEATNIPSNFNGFKIIHISDLHGKSFGKNQKNIVNTIKKENPDIIVITGDIIDRRRYDEKNSLKFISEACKICPVYFVTGNHEMWSGKFYSLSSKMKKRGVKVLRNTNDIIKKGNDKIYIMGIDDPAVIYVNKEDPILNSNINKAYKGINKNDFKILLSHRPERTHIYTSNNIDLVFCGHAHGGQIRLPFLGALYAPGQGFFPKYTSGVHKIDNCNIVISRGLGNSSIPQRIFNRPELVIVTLK